jgi:hypothetical protein
MKSKFNLLAFLRLNFLLQVFKIDFEVETWRSHPDLYESAKNESEKQFLILNLDIKTFSALII